jgi:hypothetical protein
MRVADFNRVIRNFSNYPISHIHAMPAITNSAIKVPQMMDTHFLERRSISDSPTMLLSRICLSAFQMVATKSMSSESMSIPQSMIRRIGIMLEYSKPCFLKNSWDSALILSVRRVMRLKLFCLAKSTT